MHRYFKKIAGVGSGNYIYTLENVKVCLMKGLILLRHLIIVLLISHYGTKTRVKFSGSCLKQDKATYNGTIVNIYIVYNISSYPTLENCLFRAVSLTKHIDIDQYNCSEYGIGFDRKGEFSFGNGFGRNVIILWEDMSSSVHANNKTRSILVIGKDIIQGIDNITIFVEKLHSMNFTKTNTKFCLILHYNGASSYLFVNGTEMIKFEAKESEICCNVTVSLKILLKTFI